ncbi:MAG: fimbrillin family protein [Tannerellaceae bacterium]|nr:fimbrillin family protein [Tannerellaceae bacterium]
MRTKFLSVVTISTFLFIACNKDDNQTPALNNGMVKFSSGIETTKVGGINGDQWEGTEEIGIYMVTRGTSDITESADNVLYTTKSQGTSAEFESEDPIFYPVDETTKVDFIAYHSHTTTVSDYVYPVDLSNQSNQSKIDLMVATADNNGIGYDKEYTGTVDLDFSHQLAKMVINVTAGDGVFQLDGLSVVIKEMNTTAEFNIYTKELKNEGNKKNLTPYKQPSDYTYEAVLLPVSLDASHIVEFTIGENTYKWRINDNTSNISNFDKGNKYTFDVKLLKSRVLVIGIIEPWNPINGGTGEAR